MNIGFVIIPYQHYSGVAEYYRNLFQQLITTDRENHYTVFLPRGVGEEAFEFFGRDRCVVTQIPSSPSYIRYPKTILKDDTIEKHLPRIDLLHCFNFPIPRFRGKIVMTVHDFREDDLPEFFHPVINRFRKEVVRYNLKRADSIIAVSDFTLQRLLYHYPFCIGKSTRIYHGIRGDTVHANLLRLHAKPYILTVGHMYPYKNQWNLLLAFNRLIENPSFKHDLIVVGGANSSDEYFRGLQNIVTDKSRVVFTGAVNYEQLKAYYAHAELFVFPSLYEGFGFPMFEALTYGVPVAVSDIDVFNELLECPETTFDPHSPESISATIFNILWNPSERKKIINQGEKRLSAFTWEKAAMETLAIYKKTRQNQKMNLDMGVIFDFGREWKKYDQSRVSAQEMRTLFDGYFSIFPWEILPEKAVGYDLGCGTGRWAAQVSQRVHEIYCIEPSLEALSIAKKNLSELKNCRFLHATVDTMPMLDGSMDFGYALGVLHHIPDTEGALAACAAKLKSGAPFLVYIYYALENRSIPYLRLWQLTNLTRKGISRLFYSFRIVFSQIIAMLIYWPLARISGLFEKIGLKVDNIPLSFYRNCSFYVMRTDALDRFGTRLEKRFTKQEIQDMMQDAGFRDIRFKSGPPYWVAVGIKDGERSQSAN